MKKDCLIGKISAINAVINKFIDKRIKEEGLPILQNHIPLFSLLPEDGSPIAFNEIVSIWGISKSSLSDIISKYENQGLINKCTCEEDRRSIFISLKKEGVSIKKALEGIEAEILSYMLKDFETDEITGFEKNISKASAGISEML